MFPVYHTENSVDGVESIRCRHVSRNHAVISIDVVSPICLRYIIQGTVWAGLGPPGFAASLGIMLPFMDEVSPI